MFDIDLYQCLINILEIAVNENLVESPLVFWMHQDIRAEHIELVSVNGFQLLLDISQKFSRWKADVSP